MTITFTVEELNKLAEVNKKIGLSSIKGNNIIFIYCPPKVGSTTLVSSIRFSAIEKFHVLHIHDEIALQVLTGITNVKIIDIIKYNSYLGKNIYVIDIFRTPIERKMSEYFDKLAYYHFNNTNENIKKYNMNKIINRFNKIFNYIGNGDHYFDVYDINALLPEKFDFEKKYLLIEKDGIKYIKLRLKDSSIWGSILTEILGVKIWIINDYETDKNVLGELYKEFKEQYTIPYNYFETLMLLNTLNYYYTAEERKEYLKVWREKTKSAFIGYNSNEYKLYMDISTENQIYNDIQFNHYRDSGCLCIMCRNKRLSYRLKIKKNIDLDIRIIHTENELSYNDLQQQQLQRKSSIKMVLNGK